MNGFWRNKKVLVTGASGFIGSHVTLRLIRSGARVETLTSKKIPPQGLLFDAITTSRILKATTGDVCDQRFVHALFKGRKFDFCFHFAAQPLVEIAGADPLATFNVNIKGTWNILEAARLNGLEGLIVPSTSHVYGDYKPPFLEEYFPRLSRPYETSKACADMIAQTYANYYSLPVAVARCVNIYGPGDQNIRLIPRTIRLLLNNKSPEIYENVVRVIRDYMYVDDAVTAFLELAERIKDLKEIDPNIVYNFGTGKRYTVSDVVHKIIRIFGKTSVRPITLRGRKNEISRQYVSIKKAEEILGWRPKHSLDEGLRKTINWYQQHERFSDGR